METTWEMVEEVSVEEAIPKIYGDSIVNFLEYGSDSKRGGDIYTILDDASCIVLTQGQ